MAGDFRMSAEIVFHVKWRSSENTDARSYKIHVCAQQFWSVSEMFSLGIRNHNCMCARCLGDLATCLSQICLSWCPGSEFAPPVSVFVCFFVHISFSLIHMLWQTYLVSFGTAVINDTLTFILYPFFIFVKPLAVSSKPHQRKSRETLVDEVVDFGPGTNIAWRIGSFLAWLDWGVLTWWQIELGLVTPTSFGFRGKFWVRNSKALFLGGGSS